MKREFRLATNTIIILLLVLIQFEAIERDMTVLVYMSMAGGIIVIIDSIIHMFKSDNRK